MPVITLGSRSFAGPFLLPLWSPGKTAGVYAVLVPGWRLLTFRALHFDHTDDFSAPSLLKAHPRYAEWLRIAGTDWNLYVATHDMSFSTAAQRGAAERELVRQYRPVFEAPSASPQSNPQSPSLTSLILAQALRTHRPE